MQSGFVHVVEFVKVTRRVKKLQNINNFFMFLFCINKMLLELMILCRLNSEVNRFKESLTKTKLLFNTFVLFVCTNTETGFNSVVL